MTYALTSVEGRIDELEVHGSRFIPKGFRKRPTYTGETSNQLLLKKSDCLMNSEWDSWL